jgi:Fe2+ transport system protein FeoA
MIEDWKIIGTQINADSHDKIKARLRDLGIEELRNLGIDD